MVNVLLIGNGAREHVIAESIMASPQSPRLFAYMKSRNPGIAKLCEDVSIGKYDNLDEIKAFAEANKIDFAIIGPEDPLNNGVVDALEEIGIKSVGPKKNLARLETSKSFTRLLLKKYNIPGNPKFKVFNSMEGVKEYLRDELKGEFVVKADGLKGGKGVKVSGDHLKTVEEGVKYAQECVDEAGKVIIDEKLIGQEFSLMSFCDGKNTLDTVPVQDHKRAFNDDKGPNTGGMGSYSDADHLLPFLKKEDIEKASRINKMVAEALLQECGEQYKGIVYGGFIVTKDGVKLIEYNARFGDPEVMNVLPILKTDFVKICLAVMDGTLDKIKIEFAKKATVCKYAVPEGYPGNPVKNEKVDVSDIEESGSLKMYYASIDERNGELYMTGSRAIGFVGIGDNLETAEKIAEKAVNSVKGKVFHRTDIGTKALIHKRVEHMKRLRGK